ncbi:MAG: hypothetical protein AVDCRST_MAG02-2506 [uncultured Rubrobacteraceae bacterium]|uniref:Uncharacterized protein n=1 Tax=uncultured Rubrobacteraceae bacterium TaxID=349277 RepID=A0A6J4R421_9ACTN|nr:MAG: hypothetical protein AVDCRST_MAG02-2506 [uncultured Rubrobacteraceae bacterium]
MAVVARRKDGLYGLAKEVHRGGGAPRRRGVEGRGPGRAGSAIVHAVAASIGEVRARLRANP